LTNVSQDLPGRKLINRAFLVTAITFRLDSTIIDPLTISYMPHLELMEESKSTFMNDVGFNQQK
jgi:cobalamin-dependent methionine synthase I